MGHSRTPAQDTAGEGFPAGPLELLAYRPSERLHNVWGGATGARVRLERLGPQHTLDDFYCGNTDLDAWLKRHALAARQMGSARTFVLIEGDRVVGYFSLTMGAVLRPSSGQAGARPAVLSSGHGPARPPGRPQRLPGTGPRRPVASRGVEGGDRR